jgi:hypothetical protein
MTGYDGFSVTRRIENGTLLYAYKLAPRHYPSLRAAAAPLPNCPEGVTRVQRTALRDTVQRANVHSVARVAQRPSY